MDVNVIALPTFDKLCLHVHETLCARDRLDPLQAPMEQALIVRSGKPCGLFFQVKGPRLQNTYALWAGDENRILFYDSTGIRFAETRLSEGPDPQDVGSVASLANA
jgi:hypothetical protein